MIHASVNYHWAVITFGVFMLVVMVTNYVNCFIVNNGHISNIS